MRKAWFPGFLRLCGNAMTVGLNLLPVYMAYRSVALGTSSTMVKTVCHLPSLSMLLEKPISLIPLWTFGRHLPDLTYAILFLDCSMTSVHSGTKLS
ncbi:hypothetical protein BJV77DRAFT_992095 [Russula vinacea]|nr:hypothetical protein BJV77DRAFT_992095 [Russula vinacea]